MSRLARALDAARRIRGRELEPRTAIVREELARFRRPRYLEIGIAHGATFLQVEAASKVGVDPAARIPGWKLALHPGARGAELVRSTSDEYFESLPPQARFDVVFVDGDHTHEQALADIENAVRHLGDDGVVLAHDCNPPDRAAGLRDPLESKEQGSAAWCGDVWRAIVELRGRRGDLDVSVLDTDFGVGVVRRREQSPPPLAGVDATALDFDRDLVPERERLLGLRPWSSPVG